MFFHNSLDGVQAESSSLSNFLSSEKRFKDVRQHFGRDPWAVIAYLYYHTSIVTVGSDPELALSVHGVNRVINDVGPHLIELAAE
jgi:hypothetical protein